MKKNIAEIVKKATKSLQKVANAHARIVYYITMIIKKQQFLRFFRVFVKNVHMASKKALFFEYMYMNIYVYECIFLSKYSFLQFFEFQRSYICAKGTSASPAFSIFILLFEYNLSKEVFEVRNETIDRSFTIIWVWRNVALGNAFAFFIRLVWKSFMDSSLFER